MRHNTVAKAAECILVFIGAAVGKKRLFLLAEQFKSLGHNTWPRLLNEKNNCCREYKGTLWLYRSSR